MILWNTKIECLNDEKRFISKIDNRHYVLTLFYDRKKGLFYKKYLKAKAVKCPLNTPYRLRSKKNLIDTYLTTTFLIQKETGEIVFRRLCDIRYEHKMIIWNNDDFVYEKIVSILQDPAKMMLYKFDLDNSNCLQYDAIVANGFIIKAKPS